MRNIFNVKRGLLLLCTACFPGLAFGCDRLSSGQPLWVRLTDPISTYTAKVGDPIHAVLTQELTCDNEIVLPMGTRVDGVVLSKRKVGWGIRHETAALEIEFNHADAGSDAAVEFTSRVEDVENAREPVHKGVIQGIRSSNTFQGSINSRLIHLPTWNPYSDPVLVAYKAVFPIFPEPEIYYPAGTDIRLRTTSEVSLAPMTAKSTSDPSSMNQTKLDELEQLVSHLPSRVTTKKNVDADLINILFLGSHDTVRSAFHEAGWDNADPVSKRTVMKNLYALLNNSGYAREPMMTFYLNGEPEDMNWQKSLNSYHRRDHLRIWHWTPAKAGEDVWISSSTRDTGAVLALKQKRFVHHISPEIDEERSTIVRDLNFAGCVKSVNYISRPGVPVSTHNAIGDVMHTDGAIAVVALQSCKSAYPQLEPKTKNGSYKPGNHVFRFFRRQILTFRNDIFRANIIYGTYDVSRMAWVAMHHQSTPQQ